MKTNSHKLALNNQRGIALIASLIIMLLMTLVAISVFRGNSLFEKIAGNTREKQRALQVAQDALLAGENWIGTQTTAPATSPSCSTAPSSFAVCPVPANPTTTPSTIDALASTMFSYKPSSTMNANGGGGVTSTGDIVYSQSPGVFIYYMGLNKLDSAPLYVVTAFGYAGTAGTNRTEAIVQSVYEWKVPAGGGAGGGGNTSKCLSCS